MGADPNSRVLKLTTVASSLFRCGLPHKRRFRYDAACIPQQTRRSKRRMSFSAPCLSAVLLTILSLSASLCAQSTTAPATKVTPGSISGQVTIKDKGVQGVAIGLRKGDLYTPSEGYQRTTTDPDGFYRISNVAAGSYTLIVAAPAFVPDAKDTSKQKTVLVGD